MVIAAQLDGLLTRQQVARRLDCSGELVAYLWRTGKLEAVGTPYGRLAPREAVEQLKIEREQRRRDGRR